MEGDIKKNMCDGINNSQCVVVFITRRYVHKVDGDNAGDNCKVSVDRALFIRILYVLHCFHCVGYLYSVSCSLNSAMLLCTNRPPK